MKKYNNIIRSFIIFLITLFGAQSPAFAIQTISINQGHADPIPIAINRFAAESNVSRLSNNILDVITNDLKNSGLFRPISPAAFIENKTGVEHRPLFAAWRQINATVLVNGKVRRLESGNIEISFVLWDIIAERDIAGEILEMPEKLWRRAAHKIADTVYERVTGDKGYFDTRVAYISETGGGKNKIRRLAIMDQDGFNHSYLTDGKNLVLTPRFSPQGDKILYLSFLNRKARIHLRDLKTGRDSILGNFPGMSFSPRFSPDGRAAVLSMAKDGVTNLFEIDLYTKKVTRLTSGGAISTSPSYSPDGSKIVFNSDRSGSRQLYVMNADGSNVERISFGTGIYASPAWSPRGDYIAFTKQIPGEGFAIGVMRPDGSAERLITNGYLTEGPTWAPSGRVLMFARGYAPYNKQSSRSRINMIDITGYNEKEIPTPKDASDPEWSYSLD